MLILGGQVENELLTLKKKFRFVYTWTTPMTSQMYTYRNDLTEQRWQRHWTAARQSGAVWAFFFQLSGKFMTRMRLQVDRTLIFF